MSLFLAKSFSTSNYELATAEANIISIVKMDTGVGFDEAVPVTIEGASCVEVTYNRTLTGPTCTRIDAFVHDTGFTTPQQIIVIGVPSGTIMPDGTDISSVAGITYNIGTTGAPFTSHICLAYDTGDCHGSGHWVDKQGGGTTTFPPDVILYHELAHAFDYATGIATTEPLAETDENDMRDVRGLPHRNTASHNGGCGGGPTPCCIVVSLATESPYSDEVKRLRYIREHSLRRSIVGDDFFNELHYRYYEFSPGVTSLMGHNPYLGALVKKWFVQPLVEALEMLIYYSDQQGKEMADFFSNRVKLENFSPLYQKSFVQQLSLYLSIIPNLTDENNLQSLAGNHEDYPAFESLLKYINKKTLQDEYISWALTSPVRIWTETALAACSGKPVSRINPDLTKRIIEWLGHLPVSDVWEKLSRLETETELNYLEQFMFDKRTKKIFSGRLIAKYPRYRETILKWSQQKKEMHHAG